MRIKKMHTKYILFSVAMMGVGFAEAGDPDAGAGLAMVCQACHGPGGNSAIPSMFPSLAGRDAGELAALLTAYRDGDKTDPQMAPQAQGLSDQEIKDLAAYFSSQTAQ